MQKSNQYVEGVFKPRDKVLTVIDLAKYLDLGLSEKPERDIFIITGFNNSEYAFHAANLKNATVCFKAYTRNYKSEGKHEKG